MVYPGPGPENCQLMRIVEPKARSVAGMVTPVRQWAVTLLVKILRDLAGLASFDMMGA